jgi:protease I
VPTSRLQGKRVAILVADNFEQIEMTSPRDALQDAGARPTLIAPKAGDVHGMKHIERGDRFHVDMTYDQANPDDFDALQIPGGVVNADQVRMIPQARNFVRRFDEQGKPIAVICHGPWLLVSANVLRGRTLTSWPTLQDDIRNAGGTWVDREVCRDGNWVSSRKPDDLPAFNREMVALFEETAARPQRKAG